MKRDIIKEIDYKRIRSHELLNDKMIICDLKHFEDEINSIPFKENHDYNILRSISVSICSAFESFSRFHIEALIDNKKIDFRRILKIDEIRNFKCDILMMQEILKKKISLGEIVAKLTRINKIRTINAAFSILLDYDFLKELNSFKITSKQESLNLQQIYWEENYAIILKDLNAVYEVRNITCHEFSFVISIDKKILLRYLKHSIIFLERISAFFDSLWNPPQIKKRKKSENIIVKNSFLEVEKKLDVLVKKICDYTTKVWYDTLYLSSNLETEIFYWRKHRKTIAKNNCWIYEGSASYYWHYWHQMEVMTIEMINTLSSRHENLFDEVDRYSKIQKFI